MAKQPRPLAGKVVAITGAARGIGRATAQALQREGAKVAIGDVDADLARRTAEEIGERVAAFPLDVTDRESFARFLGQTEEAFGPLDVIVNNAGIMPLGPFVEEDDATAARQIDINCHGVILGMKLALPGMLERGRGHIVNISSGTGKAGYAGAATYSGTKHFVIGVSEAVRNELRDTDIEVSVVMRGVVNTELTSGMKKVRAVKSVEPEDVAEGILEALRFPRFDVYVPKVVGPLTQAISVLPRPAREAIARALKADRILSDVDTRERQAYEERAARSEPGREPERGEVAAAVSPPTDGGQPAQQEGVGTAS